MPRFFASYVDPEEGVVCDVVEAKSPGAARGLITWTWNLSFTQKGVSIRKLTDCDTCKNAGYIHGLSAVCPNCDGRCVDPRGISREAHRDYLDSLRDFVPSIY